MNIMKARAFLVIFPIVMATAQAGSDPLIGWQSSGSRSYQCFDTAVTYSDAVASCAGFGGRLAAEVLRDPAAASYIATNCVGKAWHYRRPWIGFTDIAEEGQWQWSDGGDMDATTTEWKDREPNNLRGEEDCGHIWDRSVDEGKLFINDNSCDKSFSYICEV